MSDHYRGWFPSNYVVLICQVGKGEEVNHELVQAPQQYDPVDASPPRQPLPSNPDDQAEFNELESSARSGGGSDPTRATDPENPIAALLTHDTFSISEFSEPEAAANMADELYEVIFTWPYTPPVVLTYHRLVFHYIRHFVPID